MIDYLKEVLRISLEAFEFDSEEDVYNLPEEHIDKNFIKKINKNIKELKTQIKEVESFTEEELLSIVNKKNEDNIQKINNHNSEMLILKEHLESLYKKVFDWDVKNKNLIYLKTCMLNELLEILNYKCILMKPLEVLEPKKYKEDTISRIETKLKQQQNVKKDYVTRVKEKNKMVQLLKDNIPSLLKDNTKE